MPPRAVSKKSQHARNKRTKARTSPTKSQRGKSRTTALARPNVTEAGSSSEADSQLDDQDVQEEEEALVEEEVEDDDVDGKLPPSLQYASLKSQVLDVVSRTDPALQLNARLWASLHLLHHFSELATDSDPGTTELRDFLESFTSGPTASSSAWTGNQGNKHEQHASWTLGEEISAGLERHYRYLEQSSRDADQDPQHSSSTSTTSNTTDAWAAKLEGRSGEVQQVARRVEGAFEEVVQHVNVVGSASRGKVGAEEVLGAAQESGISQEVLQRCVRFLLTL